MPAIVKQLGYTSVIGSIYANNVRSLRAFSRDYYEFVVPRTGFLVGAGWQDFVFRWVDVSNQSPIDENVDEKRCLPSLIEGDTDIIRSKL